METTATLFPCKSLDRTLDFYRTLGFSVSYAQDEPYIYAAVCRGDVTLHFSKLTTWGTKHAVCLVFVPEIGSYHTAFADALRKKYGRVPTAGSPRLTRPRPNATRFHVVDPDGNALIYIDQHEGDADYTWFERNVSELEGALDNAVFLRDTYVNDVAAARVLDKALARHGSTASPIDHARALAARAELAVAMGETALADSLRAELKGIALTDDERANFRHELEAADTLERWITGKGSLYDGE